MLEGFNDARRAYGVLYAVCVWTKTYALVRRLRRPSLRSSRMRKHNRGAPAAHIAA